MIKEYEGMAFLGITTGAYLTDPESAFLTVSLLNQRGYNLALELYSFHTPKWVSKALWPLLGNLDQLPIPKRIDPKDPKNWMLFYPNAQVTQLHLPFAYDFKDALRWVAHLGKDSPTSNIHHLGHLVCFGWATDGNTEKITDAINNPDLILNIHQDVIQQAVRRGKLEQFTRLGKVAVEDSTNPPAIVRELVEPLNLGFTLGLDHPDHLETAGLSIAKVLRDEGVRRYTTAIHLAGPNHGRLRSDDLAAGRVLEEIAVTPFHHPVTAYLDLHPSTIAGMGVQAELAFWSKQFDWIKSTQPQLTKSW